MTINLLTEQHLEFLSLLHRLICVYTCQNATLLEITCRSSLILMNRLNETDSAVIRFSEGSVFPDYLKCPYILGLSIAGDITYV